VGPLVDGVTCGPFDGGVLTTFGPNNPSFRGPFDVAVAGGRVYFVASGALSSAPIAGGSTATLAPSATALTVDDARVYWIAGDAVLAEPLAGGTPVTVVNGLGTPTAIAVDALNVYVADAQLGLLAAPK
jgi:hypothetical protein